MLAKTAARRAERRSERLAVVMTRLSDLGEDVVLTTEEVAAVVGRSVHTVRSWRYMADHPLRWRKRGNLIEYRVGDVRKYLHGEDQVA